jgi:hypothetical protein
MYSYLNKQKCHCFLSLQIENQEDRSCLESQYQWEGGGSRGEDIGG